MCEIDQMVKASRRRMPRPHRIDSLRIRIDKASPARRRHPPRSVDGVPPTDAAVQCADRPRCRVLGPALCHACRVFGGYRSIGPLSGSQRRHLPLRDLGDLRGSMSPPSFAGRPGADPGHRSSSRVGPSPPWPSQYSSLQVLGSSPLFPPPRKTCRRPFRGTGSRPVAELGGPRRLPVGEPAVDRAADQAGKRRPGPPEQRGSGSDGQANAAPTPSRRTRLRRVTWRA